MTPDLFINGDNLHAYYLNEILRICKKERIKIINVEFLFQK